MLSIMWNRATASKRQWLLEFILILYWPRDVTFFPKTKKKLALRANKVNYWLVLYSLRPAAEQRYSTHYIQQTHISAWAN